MPYTPAELREAARIRRLWGIGSEVTWLRGCSSLLEKEAKQLEAEADRLEAEAQKPEMPKCFCPVCKAEMYWPPTARRLACPTANCWITSVTFGDGFDEREARISWNNLLARYAGSPSDAKVAKLALGFMGIFDKGLTSDRYKHFRGLIRYHFPDVDAWNWDDLKAKLRKLTSE